MPSFPVVSVCIPCYNAQEFVAEAINSALNQSYPHVEVVVVDDGSSDQSVEVLRSFGDKIIFEAAPNRGACAARNRALELSSGEFIQFLDADDRLKSNKLERQLPFLLSGEFDLVFCNGYLFGDAEGMRPKKTPIADPTNVDPFVYCIRQGLSTEGPLHRRECVERVGGFRENLKRAQEYEMHVRMAATGVRIHYLAEFLCEHRHHDGPRITRTAQPPDHMVRLLLELADTLEHPPYNMTEERKTALANSLFRHGIYAFRNGAESAAADAFARAKTLSSNIEVQERAAYRAMIGVFGPLPVERAMKVARNIKYRGNTKN